MAGSGTAHDSRPWLSVRALSDPGQEAHDGADKRCDCADSCPKGRRPQKGETPVSCLDVTKTPVDQSHVGLALRNRKIDRLGAKVLSLQSPKSGKTAIEYLGPRQPRFGWWLRQRPATGQEDNQGNRKVARHELAGRELIAVAVTADPVETPGLVTDARLDIASQVEQPAQLGLVGLRLRIIPIPGEGRGGPFVVGGQHAVQAIRPNAAGIEDEDGGAFRRQFSLPPSVGHAEARGNETDPLLGAHLENRC